MRRAIPVLLALAGAWAWAPLAFADPEARPPPISLERVVGDGYLGPLLEGPRWRPGTPEVTYWTRDPRALVALDVASGERRTLVAASALDALRQKDEPVVSMRGIGRAPPPSHQWDEAGAALLVAHRGDLYRVGPSGAVERLTRARSPISDPRFSPDGTKACFARDHDLWAVLAGAEGRTLRLTEGGSDDVRNGGLDWVYPEELGCDTGVWWAPGSDRVAFLRLEEAGVRRASVPDLLHGDHPERQPYPLPGEQNPRARVGVVGLDGKPPTWMDLGPGVEYVPWAAWLPDGSRVLVATLDRRQRRLALRSCDPATGAGETALVEEEADAWVEPPEPPVFVPGRRAFVWRRPRDGHWRPVLVELPEAGAPRQTALGADPFEADRVVAVDASAAYVEGNDGDATERALFRVALEGGAATRLTEPRGWHRTDVDAAGGRFLDAWSSAARAPRQAAFRLSDGAPLRALADAETADLRALAVAPPEAGALTLPDGTVLRTRLRRPAPLDPTRRHPVVVFVYGGPMARTVRDAWDGLFDALLAQEGFAVLSVDNRGSSGCGRGFETLVCRRLGRLELEDHVAAVSDLVARHPWADRARVGIWGWSYGGTMACLGLLRAPGVFRAGVAVAPVTDWRLYDSIYTERYLGLPLENPEGYRDGSPLTHAARLEGALLLCHGLSDDNVHFRHTALLVDALVREKKRFDLMAYPGKGHGIEGPRARLDVYTRILEHFRRHLGAPEAPR